MQSAGQPPIRFERPRTRENTPEYHPDLDQQTWEVCALRAVGGRTVVTNAGSRRQPSRRLGRWWAAHPQATTVVGPCSRVTAGQGGTPARVDRQASFAPRRISSAMSPRPLAMRTGTALPI